MAVSALTTARRRAGQVRIVLSPADVRRSTRASHSKLNVTWSVALLTFLESAAVYLRCAFFYTSNVSAEDGCRDTNVLAQAAAAAKTGQKDHAVDLLRSADAPINAVVRCLVTKLLRTCPDVGAGERLGSGLHDTLRSVFPTAHLPVHTLMRL
jgi:hypothetical protein